MYSHCKTNTEMQLDTFKANSEANKYYNKLITVI